MSIRLRRGGAYLADLDTLRRLVEANGPRPTMLPVTVVHPESAHTIDVYLNLAYEGDRARPRPPASLCVLGWRNGQGAWHFRVPGVASLPDALIPGGCTGSYAGLGHPHELPALTNADLGRDVAALATYAGRPLDQALRDSLARMIVVVSEALRFDSVAAGVSAILAMDGSFRPHAGTLRAWDGHTLGMGRVSPWFSRAQEPSGSGGGTSLQ
ncbi:hypothetical protein HAV22_15690 [Massilia sp. TW-1]|uniref:rRNA N-glycosidase n=1 Tax=Telluria antibiotica TaxID=2717319 RepID=A0ABX0PEP3_9BURK|nr:ribosome-inactivating family protein [Telluria antibiotica]NIA55079.1 hypothetical protein [Telluria antibiotica]